MTNLSNLKIDPLYPIPNKRQLEWFDRERMIFFHFGMNTFTDKEWGDGTESPSSFNPTELDVEQWIKVIKECGFKAAILTAKHHDGFCLWQTKYTDHSIKSSPYKNGKGDIVKEFVDACEKHQIKAGIYLSPWDRHEKTWGKDEYNDFYVGQLTELLTNYGKIWEVWWDGAGSTEAVYDWARWAKCVKDNQPDAVIFGSLGATDFVDVRWVGNEKGIAGKPCYSTIDKSSLIYEYTDELNHGKVGGEAFIPAEVDVSIRPGWFYHASQDLEVRTPQNLLDLWFTSNGSNAGFLLNLPPDRRGLIHENDVASLKEFNRLLNNALSCNFAKDATYYYNNSESILTKDSLLVLNSECKEIIFELGEECTFNAFSISEEISLGQRVLGIEFSAYVNDSWLTLSQAECVGYRLCEKFEPVTSKRVKITVTKSLDTPILKSFGLYLFQNEAKDSQSKKISVKDIAISNKSVDANLGGIYPFDRICVGNGPLGKYTLYIFNGTSLEKYKDGESDKSDFEIVLDSIVDYAYRFKIDFENEFCPNITLNVKNGD